MTPWTTWLATRRDLRERRGVCRDTSVMPRGLLDLASNDYLGLAAHPQVRAAAAEFLQSGPVGAGGSRLVTGTHPIHLRLEEELSAFAGAERGLVFSSGYLANLGLLGALGGPHSRILLDAHVHASLHDAARLAHAEVTDFPHHDLTALETLLSSGAQRTTVVVESIYSVCGDAAPLESLVALCQRYGAALVVDEAHSFAVVAEGTMARAIHAWDNAGDAPVFVTATLSKALGAQGGAVLFGGPDADAWRDHVINTARGFIFDTGLAPVVAAGARAALHLAVDEDRAARARHRADTMRAVLEQFPRVFDRLETGPGALMAIHMPDATSARAVADELEEHGIAVGCFRKPSVPDGHSRLRITASARLSEAQATWAAEVVGTLADRTWGGPLAAPFALGDGRPDEHRGEHLLVDDPAEVRRILAAPEGFPASNALTALRGLTRPTGRTLASVRFRLPAVLASANGDSHRAVRQVVARFFSPARVREQQPLIRTATRHAIEALTTAEGPVNLATTVAGSVPAEVFSRLTGMPLPAHLQRWSADSLELFWGWPSDGRQEHLARSAAELHAWLRSVVQNENDPASLIGALAASGLDTDRVISLAYFLVIAGQETTRMLIATTLLRALSDASLWRACQDRDHGFDTCDALVGEVLTRSSSVPTWRRVAAVDTEVSGRAVPAGTELVLQLSGPEQQDADLAFGYGVHRCLGAGLARMETATIVHETAMALPDASLTGPAPTWVDLLSFQAPRHVWVSWP